MKILMLGWELPPNNSGGLGVACLNLARALAKDGMDIDFVVPYKADHSDIDFMQVLPAVKLDPLYKYGFGAYDTKNLEKEAIPMVDSGGTLSLRAVQRKYCEFVRDYLKTERPDVVHAHDWLTFEAGVLAKKQFGIPFVAQVHATEFDRSGMHGGNPVVHEVEREGLLMADKILAVSEGTKRIVHEKYAIPLEKIDVVYNSLDEGFLNSKYEYDENDYAYLEEMKRLGYTIVATVGRFTIQKGLNNLLRAAAKAISKNPKMLFVFAGDGEQKDELIEESAKLGIAKNVLFTGFVRGKQLRDIYAAADIFVMSSISEPFGLTALEAAHHGDVLILTKQSGVAEVLRSTMEYDFWDENKLANQLVAVSKSGGLRKMLARGVAQEYRKISWDDVAEKVASVYEKVERRNR